MVTGSNSYGLKKCVGNPKYFKIFKPESTENEMVVKITFLF